MNLTTHGLVGAALGSLSPSWLAGPVGMASHVLLDMLPHRDYDSTWMGVADLAVTMAAVAGIAARSDRCTGVWLGALGATLPDVEVAACRLSRGRVRCRFWTHSGRIRHGRPASTGVTLVALGLAAMLAVCGFAGARQSGRPDGVRGR